ncbi:MAG: transglutaminase family protein [Deltaproteobacteria bacterium]|nr:transglutaminase family protein [Deltaproteobacteria bacterium]
MGDRQTVSSDRTDSALFCAATEFIDCDQPAIAELARSLQQADARATAIALFNWVRDHIRYDPYTALDGRRQYRASAVLERGRGYCVQKAVLLAALARACGIPARLGFADVRNHKVPPSLRQVMGTDLFVFHGYVELLLDGRWVKATPAFDPHTTAKAGALLVELDGEHDATLHPVDPAGAPHIEYVRDRGSYADVPFEEMQQVFAEVYGFSQAVDRG